ncbi:MAG: hypothetical protein PHE88_09520 [Elusimicrobia bacterium]|nr:hypothetical protein [Elusimicrobiota bacterium]
MFYLFQKNKLVLIILFFSYLLFLPPTSDDNERSRLALTYSIVDTHTFNIDKYEKLTIDKAYKDGHYYTDKAPGISLLAVPVYAVLRIFNFPPAPKPAYRYIFAVLFSAIPTIILVFYIYKFLLSITIEEKTAKLILIAYSLATIAFPFSLVFYPYQIVSLYLFISFFLIFNKNNYFYSGLLCGLAIISDYTVIPVFLYFTVYIYCTNKKSIGKYLTGIIPSLLILGIYNKLCFGNPFLIGYNYESVSQFRSEMSKGLFGITTFNFNNFFKITISSYRGLFFYSPWLIFVFLGVKTFYSTYKKEFFLFSTIIIYFFILCASYWNINGGEIIGPRILLPMLPFLVVFAGFAKKTRGLYLLILLSFIIIFSVVSSDIHLPEGEYNPLINYTMHMILKGDFLRAPSIIILYLLFLFFGVKKYLE